MQDDKLTYNEWRAYLLAIRTNPTMFYGYCKSTGIKYDRIFVILNSIEP